MISAGLAERIQAVSKNRKLLLWNQSDYFFLL